MLRKRSQMQQSTHCMIPHLYKVRKQTKQTHANQKSGEWLHLEGNGSSTRDASGWLGMFCFLISVPVLWVCSVVASHGAAPLQSVHLSEWMFGGGGRERERQEEGGSAIFLPSKILLNLPMSCHFCCHQAPITACLDCCSSQSWVFLCPSFPMISSATAPRGAFTNMNQIPLFPH